ncbi:type VI secretion system tube protein Hcp [Paenibacillus alginolyticus]|uniref:Type VI secretion system tube protein Hcp n=1 Tax=Paenibacillus alginolyticus TaxID=59839 RepID=A0ABT4G612_9BACL|nr:type VI secretion system tube protein Hcp [Paenibacillus alginolyticus]MCY9668608.1 type VI secretion system tube protein Hcp [Paenibacillus alginolyticus]MCY9691622.1 type VI secretion system tube protein Hcp [Paenibacillus alginolyticus]MEC0146942.1 type VI secretion system tube protein Hcp [Paenibacillus alginolyticus]
MRRFRNSIIFFTICLFVLAFGVVPAAAESSNFTVFLKLDGITGESVAKGYEKWIQLQDVSFEFENSSTLNSSSTSGYGAGKAVRKPMAFSKNFDLSSVPLFMDMVMGKTIEKGQLVFVKNGEQRQPIVTIDLERISVSKYNLNNLDENIELNYGAITFKYTALGPDGKPANTNTGGWDFMKNVKK